MPPCPHRRSRPLRQLTTAALDRRKRDQLARAGTVEFWEIDPALRQIQRFVFAENAAKPIALIDEPESFHSPLFPEFILATKEIFRRGIH